MQTVNDKAMNSHYAIGGIHGAPFIPYDFSTAAPGTEKQSGCEYRVIVAIFQGD